MFKGDFLLKLRLIFWNLTLSLYLLT